MVFTLVLCGCSSVRQIAVGTGLFAIGDGDKGGDWLSERTYPDTLRL